MKLLRYWIGYGVVVFGGAVVVLLSPLLLLLGSRIRGGVWDYAESVLKTIIRKLLEWQDAV